MKRWILDIICCPICKGNFMLTEKEGNETEIIEGVLICTSCKQVYPITSGVANLLPEQRD
ncbi:MAG TPA: methytransferase partner Trm112 [Methanocorpusculum sp.]|nr:methytransferase partner Trm112 [Methanocorpusculum sp.]HJJ89590.1 methytransferase partner Trm112 [Methanocorpusculum sp.]HJJ90967.1 methytransferase partner Trm112 [Methanocorpusculum sp.]HJJ92442.1 methytransferase partner Trm112 [Methanocorpusculum sp.]HJK00848.1 methytransferase partner Trm112 [Methanocorpusculum sp.]